MSKFQSITFLTRYYPPSININGESICDMVEYIQKHYPNVICNIIHVNHTKETTGGNKLSPKGNIIKVGNYLDYSPKIFKGLKMLMDGYLLVKRAKKIKNTLYVITTSPPLLPFWAGLLLGKERKRAFWALDLFPEAFAAKGVISKKNVFYKWIIKKTYSTKPEFVIALGPKQAEYITKECFNDETIKTFLLPCGFFEETPNIVKPSWYNENKIMMGYLGNIHDAHNPDFVINMIDAINPEKQTLILALYGNKSSDVIEYARNKPGVILVKSVPRNELMYIDIHLVSLLPEFTHFAVPSKAVSAITMGKTILFCGDKESDSWHLFQDTGWYIPENSKMRDELKLFCSKITKEEIILKQSNTHNKANELKDLVTQTYEFVANQA